MSMEGGGGQTEVWELQDIVLYRPICKKYTKDFCMLATTIDIWYKLLIFKKLNSEIFNPFPLP